MRQSGLAAYMRNANRPEPCTSEPAGSSTAKNTASAKCRRAVMAPDGARLPGSLHRNGGRRPHRLASAADAVDLGVLALEIVLAPDAAPVHAAGRLVVDDP